MERTNCPLCEGALTKDKTQKETSLQFFRQHPYPEDSAAKQKKIPWTGRQKRFFAFELTSLLSFLAAAVTLTTYFEFAHETTWIYITLASIGLAWLVISIPLLLMNHPILIVLGEILAILGYLAALDLQDGKLHWFEKLALPSLILVTIITNVIVFVVRKAKRKGANIAGLILFGISLLTLGINIIISIFLHNERLITWSMFVIIPAMTLALLLMYIHYRLSKIIDLRNRFKI